MSYALDFLLSTARVVVSGHDQQTSDAAKAEIGAGTLAVKANVSSLAEIDRRIAPVQAELGHIDMLFVNAGIFKGVPLQASAASSHFF
ncbi:MAG: SDR family NAD(P)-dependent oxidoreductase [Hymenobacteraceae bacterium]|nr:SDR family NAD(P)-dependent oxidoreductase [Hymenobacteraceae bacterium]